VAAKPSNADYYNGACICSDYAKINVRANCRDTACNQSLRFMTDQPCSGSAATDGLS